MGKTKNILFIIFLLTSSLIGQDREARNTIRERDLERIVHQMNNNNNDYREPDRNAPKNADTNKASTKK